MLIHFALLFLQNQRSSVGLAQISEISPPVFRCPGTYRNNCTLLKPQDCGRSSYQSGNNFFKSRVCCSGFFYPFQSPTFPPCNQAFMAAYRATESICQSIISLMESGKTAHYKAENSCQPTVKNMPSSQCPWFLLLAL